MRRETLWSRKQMTLQACVMVLCGAAFSAQAEPPGEHLLTGNISIGYQQWTALADLDTEKFGSFEEGGFNLSASGHGRWKHWNNSTVLLGADLGLIFNDSNIRAPGDTGNLSADILFMTPSIRPTRSTGPWTRSSTSARAARSAWTAPRSTPSSSRATRSTPARPGAPSGSSRSPKRS